VAFQPVPELPTKFILPPASLPPRGRHNEVPISCALELVPGVAFGQLQQFLIGHRPHGFERHRHTPHLGRVVPWTAARVLPETRGGTVAGFPAAAAGAAMRYVIKRGKEPITKVILVAPAKGLNAMAIQTCAGGL
jgi:hypothetical protein